MANKHLSEETEKKLVGFDLALTGFISNQEQHLFSDQEAEYLRNAWFDLKIVLEDDLAKLESTNIEETF